MDRSPRYIERYRSAKAYVVTGLTCLALVGCGAAPKPGSADPKPRGGEDLIFAAKSPADDHFKLYDKDLRTGIVARLTDGPGDDNNPQASPDGTKITFYSDRNDGINQVFMFDRRQPTKVIQLTHNPAHTYDPTYLRDGSIVYKYRDGIWQMDRNGSNQHRIVQVPGVEAYKPAAVSNDELSFTGRSSHTGDARVDANSDELYLYNFQTHAIRHMPANNSTVSDWFSAIDPKTGNMAFVSRDNPDGPDRIYMALPYTSERKSFPGLGKFIRDCSDVSWASDTGVVFVNDDGGTYDTVYTANTSGGLQELYRQTGAIILAPIIVPALN